MSQAYTFEEMIAITRKVIQTFETVEQRPWTVETILIELMKQVGDLSKRILTKEQYYLSARSTNPQYATTVEDIGDELADIFYCLIRLADYYHINLEEAHLEGS